jgi:nucleoside-diphosphate-sugar epimerase
MASSAYAKMFYKLYKVPVSIARIFMVYGPRQKDTRKLIPYTITALLKGEAPSFGSGERMVDWIYISDVVDGLIKMAVTPGLNGETICLGSGNLVSVKEVICQIFRQMNISQPPKFGILPERPLETSVVAQTKRTRTMINWQTTVNMETGLGNTVNWYRQRYSSIAIRDPYSGNFKNKSI